MSRVPRFAFAVSLLSDPFILFHLLHKVKVHTTRILQTFNNEVIPCKGKAGRGYRYRAVGNGNRNNPSKSI